MRNASVVSGIKRGAVMKKNSAKAEETSILLEASRMNREKAILVVDKAMLIYFSFIVLGVLGFTTNHIGSSLLNLMIFLGFGVLIVGFISYIMTMHKEEKHLKSLLRRNSGKNKG